MRVCRRGLAGRGGGAQAQFTKRGGGAQFTVRGGGERGEEVELRMQ